MAEAQIETEKALEFPRYFQVETISLCNARCRMCLTRNCQRERRVMSEEVFDQIVDELRGYAGHIVQAAVQAAGEPLLDKELERRIKQLKEVGIRYVVFATNGSLMSRERGRSVIATGVDEVTFSVDGAKRQTYERIRVGLNFAEVVNNIEGFIQVRDEMQAETIVRIRMTEQEGNRGELDEFVEFWNERLGPRDSAYGKVIHTWGNSPELTELPAGYDYESLNEKACSSLWSSMVIFSDGRVPLCCCDYNGKYPLGRIGEQTIQEMWQGYMISRIRRQHLAQGRKALKMCRNCTTWDRSAKLVSQG